MDLDKIVINRTRMEEESKSMSRRSTILEDPKYVLYPRRHIMLMLYCLATAMNAVCWISLQSIAT